MSKTVQCVKRCMNMLFYVCFFVFLCTEINGTMARGRDTELVALRNEELLRRYYYWTEIKRLRFDDTYRILSTREFFISEERIRTIVNQNYEFLQELDREYRSGKNTEDKPPMPPKRKRGRQAGVKYGKRVSVISD